MPNAEDETYALLLGSSVNVDVDDAYGAGLTPGAIGVLRRLAQNFPGDPCGPHQQIALGAGAAGLLVPDLAMSAMVTVEVQPVRMRCDGLPATAAVGLLLPAGTVVNLTGRRTLQSVSFFTTVAGGVIDVTYWT